MLAWLVSSPSTYRQEEKESLPFANSQRHRHKVSREASQAGLKDIYQRSGIDSWQPLHVPYVLGVIQLDPKSVFHWGIALSEDVEYPQYLYYKAHGCNPLNLWMLSVRDATPMIAQVRADFYCVRHLRFTVDVVSEEDSREMVGLLPDRPAWLLGSENQVRLCVVIPGAFAKLIARSVWRQLVIPSPFSASLGGPFGGMSPRFLTKGFAADLQRFNNILGVPRDDVEDLVAFDFSRCLQCAAALQTVGGQQPAAGQQILLQWSKALMQYHDERQISQQYFSCRRALRHSRLLSFLSLAELLKSAEHLAMSIERACSLVLSVAELQVIRQELAVLPPPDKGTLSRFRLSADVAFMLWQRVQHHLEHLRHEDFCRFMLWDSSPQYHRDYELILMESVSRWELPDLWGHLETIATENFHDDLDRLTPDQKHAAAVASMNSIRHSLHVHALPATQIGFGASGFTAKASSLLHAMRLEHFTDEGVARYVSQIAAAVSDGGVESLLTRACPMALIEMLPHFEDTSATNIEALISHISLEDDLGGNRREAAQDQVRPEIFEVAPLLPALAHDRGDFGGMQDEQEFENVPAVAMADFQPCFPIPGMLHIVHNATMGLTTVLKTCEDNLNKATKVCKLLSDRGLSAKLRERCYHSRGPLGLEMVKPLKAFNARIYTGRWGTLAFAMQQLLAIESPLRWGWDRRAFLGREDPQLHPQIEREDIGEGEPDADDQLHSDPKLVATCDDAIKSDFFWSWVRLMGIIADMLREVGAILGGMACN